MQSAVGQAQLAKVWKVLPSTLSCSFASASSLPRFNASARSERRSLAQLPSIAPGFLALRFNTSPLLLCRHLTLFDGSFRPAYCRPRSGIRETRSIVLARSRDHSLRTGLRASRARVTQSEPLRLHGTPQPALPFPSCRSRPSPLQTPPAPIARLTFPPPPWTPTRSTTIPKLPPPVPAPTRWPFAPTSPRLHKKTTCIAFPTSLRTSRLRPPQRAKFPSTPAWRMGQRARRMEMRRLRRERGGGSRLLSRRSGRSGSTRLSKQ
ncbi:hypothetical protein BJY59DRAFT_122774 [Rhodotorula toruloides]